MRGLAILLLLMVASPVQSASSGPALTASVAEGKLYAGDEAPVWLKIENTAEASDASTEDQIFDLHQDREEALALTAALRSLDDRIEVLSGPQVVGSLAPEANRSAEFQVAAEEKAGAGVYPMEVTLDYSSLSEIEASGDSRLPDLFFRRSNSTLELPVEVQVVQGPRVSIEEARGHVRPGEESAVDLVLANRGDEAAFGLAVVTQPQEPFNCSSKPLRIDILEPGSSASVKAILEAGVDAAPGDYALPCHITFRTGERVRSVDSAALVTIEGDSWLRHLLFPAAAIMVIVLSLAALTLSRRKVKRRRR